MRITFKQPSRDWEPWFAWRPKFVGATLIWLETIERQAIYGWDGPIWTYRLPNV